MCLGGLGSGQSLHFPSTLLFLNVYICILVKQCPSLAQAENDILTSLSSRYDGPSALNSEVGKTRHLTVIDSGAQKTTQGQGMTGDRATLDVVGFGVRG